MFASDVAALEPELYPALLPLIGFDRSPLWISDLTRSSTALRDAHPHVHEPSAKGNSTITLINDKTAGFAPCAIETPLAHEKPAAHSIDAPLGGDGPDRPDLYPAVLSLIGFDRSSLWDLTRSSTAAAPASILMRVSHL